MKLKIKPFIKRLITENIYYILGNVFLIILIFIILKVGLTENFTYKTKINSLQEENSGLKNKITLMNSAIPKSEVLDEDVKFLNTLIPNVEDYFSIIYALEKISKKTNFVITDYTVNIGGSDSEKLEIDVIGKGDSQSFVDFLKNYNFMSGRLITSDKIELSPNFSGSLKINLTFYSKKTEAGSSLEMSPNINIYNELETLKAKVSFNFDDSKVIITPSLEYPKKSNPF